MTDHVITGLHLTENELESMGYAKYLAEEDAKADMMERFIRLEQRQNDLERRLRELELVIAGSGGEFTDRTETTAEA